VFFLHGRQGNLAKHPFPQKVRIERPALLGFGLFDQVRFLGSEKLLAKAYALFRSKISESPNHRFDQGLNLLRL